MPAGRRILPQSISTDPRFSRVSLKAKVLYPLLWVNGDDQGRLSGDPDKIKLAVCASVPEITSAEIPELIENLHNENLIISYNTSRRAAIQIVDWWEAQRPQWAWPSEYSPPQGWKDHLRYKKGKEEVITINWPPSGEQSGESPGESPGEHSGERDNETPATDCPEKSQVNSQVNSQVHYGNHKLKRKLKAQPQTQTSLRASEARAQHTPLKLDYYDRLDKARDKPQKVKKVLISFLQAELRQGDNNELYPQVGKMLKMIGSPFQLMSVMLSVRDRDQWEPLSDVMSFLWSMVNDKALVVHK